MHLRKNILTTTIVFPSKIWRLPLFYQKTKLFTLRHLQKCMRLENTVVGINYRHTYAQNYDLIASRYKKQKFLRKHAARKVQNKMAAGAAKSIVCACATTYTVSLICPRMHASLISRIRKTSLNINIFTQRHTFLEAVHNSQNYELRITRHTFYTTAAS